MYGMRIPVRGEEQVIGGGPGSVAATPAGRPLFALFNPSRNEERRAEDKQRRVSHQHRAEGKHAGDISQAVKRLYSDAAAALFSIACFSCSVRKERNDSITANTPLFPLYLPQLSVTAELILQTGCRKKFSSAPQL